MKNFLLNAALLILSASCRFNGPELSIDADFPGGNIIVDSIAGTTVYIRPDLRDTDGKWFYWNSRISCAADKTIHFRFPGSYIGHFGPAVSTDKGDTWQWLSDSANSPNNSFRYSFTGERNEVRFSTGIPYLQSDYDAFIADFIDNPNVRISPLTTSRKGRKVEKLVIQAPGSNPRYKVMLTARHHACEAMASYVLEGIIKSVLEDDDESMKWLRENAGFFIIPFIDIDGVEEGDQGKNRRPWDHLGDYAGTSIYKSTAALREQLPDWAGTDLKVALDLHCPGLRGNWSNKIYIVGAEDPIILEQQKSFLKFLAAENKGFLKLHPDGAIIEYGTGWNVSTGESERLGCREWASGLEGMSLAATLEIPYANNNGQMVTPENARAFGTDMANAIASYLKKLDP